MEHNRKFICLNDNIAGDKNEARTVRSVLKDFYSSLFPIPSKYELANDMQNKFLYQDDILEWLFEDYLRMRVVVVGGGGGGGDCQAETLR